jgi:tetratricopeptide (TPR) repeat protein
MKKTRINLALFVLAIMVLSSCGGLNKMRRDAAEVRYNVTPEVLETHAGEVEVSIRGTYPARYFHRRAIVEVTPVITWDGGETALNSITLQGENVRDNHQVIRFDGGSFTYNDRVPFDENMRISDLVVRVNARRGNSEAEFDPYKIADGVIATSTLVANNPKPVKVGDEFARIVPETKESAIFYVINRADVRQSELRSDRMAEFREYLDQVTADERIELRKVEINAYASPDGPINFNENLAAQRRETSDRVLSNELRRVNIEKKDDYYTARALGEDWDGFRELMEQSNIADRQLILRVLSMYQDPVVREREIRNISAAFTEIETEILPRLRRSVMSINVERIGHSDNELRQIYSSNPTRLNEEEILYTATLYPDPNRKLEIYTRAAQQFPNSFRAHNSVGAVQVELNNISAAKQSFQRAQRISDNDVVKNNLGAIALLEGNIEQAEEYFASVASPSSETNYNLGIVAIKKGDYPKAAGHLGNMPEVNTALVKLLQRNNDDALRILNNIQQPDAMVYYLRAIVGARRQDSSMAFDNLRTAVSRDASLKELAKTDMEFGRYFQDATFTSIVN